MRSCSLRQDNLAGDHFSLVGFQTQLKWSEQARVLRMIPGLQAAEFVRFGMIHRNTYINGPTVLHDTWQTRRGPTLFFAGQVSGVEGYVESAASGLIAGRNAARLVLGSPPVAPPRDDGHWRARATTSRTPIRTTTSRRTSRSASCRRSRRRPAASRSGSSPSAHAPSTILPPGRCRSGPVMRRSRVGTEADARHLANAFLEFLRYNRNVSPHTLRAYETDIGQFIAFIGGRDDASARHVAVGAFDVHAVRGFLGALHDRGNSRASTAGGWRRCAHSRAI